MRLNDFMELYNKENQIAIKLENEIVYRGSAEKLPTIEEYNETWENLWFEGVSIDHGTLCIEIGY